MIRDRLSWESSAIWAGDSIRCTPLKKSGIPCPRAVRKVRRRVEGLAFFLTSRPSHRVLPRFSPIVFQGRLSSRV